MTKNMTSSQFHYRWHRSLKRLQNTALHESHPTVKAHYAWKLVSEQLIDMIGMAPFTQWFSNVKPLFLVDDILIVQVENKFSSQWINQHYRDLVDALLTAQNEKYCCYFLSNHELSMMSPLWQDLLKSSTSKIQSESKDDHS
jgi:chromosomal replication initiation ATPase DnaA